MSPIPIAAVAGSDDVGAGHQRAPTHQGAAHAAPQQGNLVGELAVGGVAAADNATAAPAEHGLLVVQQLGHPGGAWTHKENY